MNYRNYPDISPKQTEIMELVKKFRFINRGQIQKFLGHKGAHRINVWLKDLVEKNFLGRIYSKKILENTKPAIYYLQNNGILWAKIRMEENLGDYELATKVVKKFYADKRASNTFIDHSISICELCIQFKELEGKKWDYDCLTKSDYYSWFANDKDFDVQRQFISDIYIEKITKTWSDSQTYCLDLFPPHVPKYYLDYRVRQYIKMKTEGIMKYMEGLDNLLPKVLFVLPNQRKLNSLARYIREMFDESYDMEGMVFMLTTYQKVQAYGVGEKKIWNLVTEDME